MQKSETIFLTDQLDSLNASKISSLVKVPLQNRNKLLFITERDSSISSFIEDLEKY